MDCLTDLAKEAVIKLGDLVVESTVKHCKYMTQHKKITSNLEEEYEKLKTIKQTLKIRVDIEKRKGYEITTEVKKWLSDVRSIETELQKWLSDENKANKNKKFFCGKCPDFAFNYSLGKQGTKSTEDITSLKEKGNNFQVISYPTAPLTLGSTFTNEITSLMSRKELLTKVIEKLKDDKVKMISICGMGGVGKTTLVKELIKLIEGSKLFDYVAMAVVSQNIDYEKIQIEIAETLDIDSKKDSLQGRAVQIFERLSKAKRVLIVLDDVWNILDFECIGIPFGEQDKSCKILFTSRDEKVCRDMGSKENYPVSSLSEEEAWYLFREMAGKDVDRRDINPIAREIAKECGGLPLAIVTVGTALKDVEKHVWEDALSQLKKSSSLPDVKVSVHPRIELSLKLLDSNEHRFLLMLCGLFSEDFDIPIEGLLNHAMGLRLIKGDTSEARNRVYTLLGDLKRKFLLLDSNVEGCVKMHDVVRDVVISVASKNAEDRSMVQYDFKWIKEEKLDNINALSLILDGTKELENGFECPTLKLLQVRAKNTEPIFWPEHFFKGMCALKVLSMQNLCIPKLPSLSQVSGNLNTLQVEYCDVGDISIIGKELIHLEVLSFAHSNIKELPIEIGNLSILRLLDLTYCNDLNVISANVFIRLTQLEELYLRMDNFPWKENDAAIEELKKIHHQLKVVEMKVRGDESFLRDLNFTNLKKFWIYVDLYSSLQRSLFLGLNVLHVCAMDYQSIHNTPVILQLVNECEILSISKVKNLKNVTSKLLHDQSPKLKYLTVDSCPNMEYLIDATIDYNGFPQIQTLTLKKLENLKEICHSSNHDKVEGLMTEFSYLVELELIDLLNFTGFNNTTISNELNQESGVATEISDSTNILDEKLSESQHPRPSHVIAKLFSSNWMKQFKKLEKIMLKQCTSLEVLFDLEGYLKSSGQAPEWLFPKLTKIEISDLQNLSYVWGIVPHCVQGFQNLRVLIISWCDSLKHIFNSNIVGAITNLEKLEVEHCGSIENIVVLSINEDDDDDNKQHVKSIGFNKLHHLSLSSLPKLVSICSDSLWLECPSLKQFHIRDCPMLEISFLPIHVDAKRDNNVDVTNCANIKDVDFQNFKENNSKSSTWSSGCMPFIPKFIHQGNVSKRNSKEASVTQATYDCVPSNFEMRSMKGKSHMHALEDLSILNCDLLDALFFHDEKYNFTILSIDACYKLKTILAIREKKEDMINSFPLLESLHLKNLPNLESLCFFGAYESWDKQQYMEEHVGDQIRIRHFPLIDELLFPNLKSLSIYKCNKIHILFSHSSINSLKHLEELEIEGCENMEEIISHEEETEASANKIIIRSLQRLVLERLRNLKTFSRGQYNLDFPSLKIVLIYNCKNLEVFSRGCCNSPMLVTIFMESGPFSNSYIQKKDINVVLQRFKAFVASQEVNMLNWTKLSNVSTLNTHCYNSITDQVFGSGGRMYATKGEAVSFQNLTNIRVAYCNNLKSLLSNSMARSLVQLQRLSVENCDLMEEIVRKEDAYIEGGNKVKTLFPKLEELSLLYLPELECVCSEDYDYDIPLCNVGKDKEIKNNDTIKISFPQLKELSIFQVPKLKCFCSRVYDYNIMVPSIEEFSNVKRFPHGNNVIVNTPNLRSLIWDDPTIYFSNDEHKPYKVHTHGDLNLTIYLVQNSKKYKLELQKLETLRSMEASNEQLIGYIKTVTKLEIINCHRLLNCIPPNMHLLSHIEQLRVEDCERLEEIFESNDMLHCELKQISNHIWKNHCQNLESISIVCCNSLKHVFPDVSMATSLPRLRWILVRDCEKMEEIIGNNNNSNPFCGIEQGRQQQQKAKIIFPSLLKIELERLPNLHCFYRSSFISYVEMSQCTKIFIKDCPKMKTFCYNGTLYTPKLFWLCMGGTYFDKYEDFDEVILRYNTNKMVV